MSIVDYLKNKGAIEFLSSQPIQKAYLFGSYSRQDETTESDIDILVDLDKSVDLFQFISIKLNLEKLLNKKVDLISSNGLSPHIRTYIDNEKILIYEKQNQR
jgi:predicted nucleotidyltransferase